MRPQEGEGFLKKALLHLHVAIEDVNEVAMRMLVAELRTDAAAALTGIGQLDDAYGIRAS